MCQMPARESTFELIATHASQEFLDLRQNSADDYVDAGRRRVQTVALVEPGVAGDAFEEERIEQRIVFRCDLRIDGLEAVGEVDAEIGDRPHAGDQHSDAAL